MLESVASPDVSSRWSYYAMSPTEMLRSDDDGPNGWNDLVAQLRTRILPQPARRDHGKLPPFVGGWIGCFSYEAGRWIEPTARGRHALTAFGLADWRFYDTLLAHDVANDAWYVAGVEHVTPPAGHPPLHERLDRLEAFVASAHAVGDLPAPAPGAHPAGRWNLSDDEYLQRVERILEYIRAGDVYQVNMTRRYEARLTAEPSRLYELLCRSNPAAYAAFLRFDDADGLRTIQSSSPELFLSLQDGLVTTRPIKGTRPRTGDAQRDAVAVAELEASEKERAELNMIIDLERNDLGRVCEYGSIRVAHAGEIERHPTVFHRTATIRGQLRNGHDAFDLIRATFPGGSITGAPKVRAMQIIDALENEARGPYCGAIGYIGVDGNMQLNLPIRTLTTIEDRVTMAVGSGIVADSAPRAELDELNAKAAGMMRAVEQCQGSSQHHAAANSVEHVAMPPLADTMS